MTDLSGNYVGDTAQHIFDFIERDLQDILKSWFKVVTQASGLGKTRSALQVLTMKKGFYFPCSVAYEGLLSCHC